MLSVQLERNGNASFLSSLRDGSTDYLFSISLFALGFGKVKRAFKAKEPI